MNLMKLFDKFDTDEKCRDYLESLRWPSGVACLRCGDMAVDPVRGRGQWMCRSCSYQFSVTAGTIMHDSHLPLRKWFAAVYLMCVSKKGVSANQLRSMIGTTYRTAWHLCHRIRNAMGNDPLTGPTLVGIVEVDETLIGGKTKGRGAAYKGNKTWVAGAIERGGQVRVERIPNVRRDTLHSFIDRNVRDEAEAIYTDDLKSYLGIGDADTRHETVNHSAGGMGRWRRSHQQHRRRVEPVQALHRWDLPQDECQASRPLPRRTGVAVQQSGQSQHLP